MMDGSPRVAATSGATTGGAGAAEAHDSAALHVTGRAAYVDDIPAPAGCLHLAFGLALALATAAYVMAPARPVASDA